jgi:hypothetical protein
MSGNCLRTETAVNKPVYPCNKINVSLHFLFFSSPSSSSAPSSFSFFFSSPSPPPPPHPPSSSSSSSIVTDVVSAVNLTKSPVLNYRQFKAFVDEIESIIFQPKRLELVLTGQTPLSVTQ